MLFTPIKPMLVTMGKQPFDDENFIFEPKWDGWRILLHKQGDRLEAYTRKGNIVTHKFPELKQITSSIKAHTAILDCEGICMRDGRPVFDDFAYRGRLTNNQSIDKAQYSHPATFVVFDVLYTDRSHINEFLLQRKQRLYEIVDKNSIIVPTTYVEANGKALSALTVERDLEGIVAKRKDSKYLPDTRTESWLKIKNFKTIDAVILGYRTDPHFALVIGLHFRTVSNKPVGVVEFGFNPEDKQAFLKIAQQIHTANDKKTQWIEPRLCCRIQYLERTDNHQLRHVSFKGFLLDKHPEDCKWVC